VRVCGEAKDVPARPMMSSVQRPIQCKTSMRVGLSSSISVCSLSLSWEHEEVTSACSGRPDGGADRLTS